MKKLILNILLFTQSAAFALPTDAKFAVHEWGTFTSVQGSDGIALGGMSHEEETLPSFVLTRDVLNEGLDENCHVMKGMPICDDGGFDNTIPRFGNPVQSRDVTQKMETPVIYFHSRDPRNVQVHVDFPTGLITQYFPSASAVTPEVHHLRGLRGGGATFNVRLATQPLAIPAVESTSVYAPARNVDANYLTTGTENEKLIFYRGMGKFQSGVQVRSIGGSLAVTNTRYEGVAHAFLINVTAEGAGFVMPLGAIAPKRAKVVTQDEIAAQPLLYDFVFQPKAMSALTDALQASGLYRDEAEAMTNTWKNSYFRNPGLRVLYVLNRAETEELLPLSVSPSPDELVRTLVGRIEIVTDVEESILLTQAQGGTLNLQALGRFAEPKLRRLYDLAQDQPTRNLLSSLINQVK